MQGVERLGRKETDESFQSNVPLQAQDGIRLSGFMI